MTIEDLGEKLFLHNLLPKLVTQPDFLNGFGHDSSILDIGLQDVAIAMKIDRAGKPVAAINGWTDYRMWGRLAVTANCSDILAVGGEPKGFMLSISVPRNWEASAVEDVVFGAEEECLRNGVCFLGGDTKESNESQVVGAALGVVKKDYYIGRKAAKRGDYLVLAGNLGGFVGSYLQAKAGVDRIDACLEYMAYPRARWVEAALVNQQRLALGGMDLSDGLFDALKSLVAPGNGIVIDIDSLPYHSIAIESSRLYSVPIFNMAFGVGDWAMLYAVAPSNIDRIRKLVKEGGVQMTVIGRVVERAGVYGYRSTDGMHEIDGIVNENFKSRMEDQGSFFDSIKNKVSLHPITDRSILSQIEAGL